MKKQLRTQRITCPLICTLHHNHNNNTNKMEMEFVDTHFHLWDVTNDEAGHERECLGSYAEAYPVYTIDVRVCMHPSNPPWSEVAPLVDRVLSGPP
jgi:hypothetical protein